MKYLIIVGAGRVVNSFLELKLPQLSFEYSILLVSDYIKEYPTIDCCNYMDLEITLKSTFQNTQITECTLLLTSWRGEKSLTDGDVSTQLKNIKKLFEVYETVKKHRLDKVINLSTFHEVALATPYHNIYGFPLEYAYTKKYFHLLLKCKTHLDSVGLINITFSSFFTNSKRQLNFVGKFLLGELTDRDLQHKDLLFDITTLEKLIDVLYESIFRGQTAENIYVGNLMFNNLEKIKCSLLNSEESNNGDQIPLTIVQSNFNIIVKDDQILKKFKLCMEQ